MRPAKRMLVKPTPEQGSQQREKHHTEKPGPDIEKEIAVDPTPYHALG
jgi:hypothetical protein